MIDVESLVLSTTVLLLLVFAAGLFRALRGPTMEDRMLSVQLLGTGGVALLMLMAELLGLPALLDVALILALLAAVAAAALTRREASND